MKRKNRITTNSIRAIRKALPRFMSLMIISMLGVFVFAGLQATSPDMLRTLDNYLDDYDTYDIKVISTMGLVEADIEAIKNIDGVNNVEGSYSKDIIIKNNEDEFVINISSIPIDINKLELVDGRMPNEADEIVVEPNMLKKEGLKLGDKINVDDDTFINKELTIVGTVDSSLYFNSVGLTQNRGNTSIGSGTINYYTYVLPENFDQSYFSAIYVTVSNTKEELTSDDGYVMLVDNIMDKIENIKEGQENLRYENLYDEISEEISKEEQEANDKLNDAKQELDSAKKELDNGKQQLDAVSRKLQSTKKELDNAKSSLNTAKKQLETFKAELDKAKEQLENARIELNNTAEQYNIDLNSLEENINTLNQSIYTLQVLLENLQSSSDEYQMYKQQLETLKAQLSSLEKINNEKNAIEENEAQYMANLETYNSSYVAYKSNLATYNSGLTQYEEGYATYQESLAEYNANIEEYNNAVDEYNQNKQEVEDKINEAKEELNNISHPTWYVYDRTNYTTYSDYIDDTNSITNLSKLFPTIFFAVAILVSLISMNRMVEEDRGEIGTLKSLGFNNKQIMHKYILFSFMATIVGCIIGAALGLIIIPLLIFNIYGLLFDIPNFQFGLNLGMTILSFIIVTICVCGTTIITVYKVLKEKPSELMRPKAPKIGKRVLLENIKFIWKHLKFSSKVIVRNIFRYKKRVLVTVVGVAGCTALMLCGFGIRDAIVDIADIQYEHIFQFDAMVYINELKEEEFESVFNNENITSVTGAQVISAEAMDISVNMFIVKDNEELNNIVKLTNTETSDIESLEEGKVIITDKFADLANIKVGDTIQILDVNNISYEYEVSAIVNNYLEHFIYMDKQTFENSNQEYEPNVVYINMEKVSEEERELLSEELLENNEVISVIYKERLLKSVDDMLTSLNKVVVILIVLAAMLSFVVLYNLSNININERKREIATLKVLGFYDKEVDNYITKENILLTLLGIVMGLVLGYFLTKAVIVSVEIEKARFIYQIKAISYVYASMLSALFTWIVNIITHFNLKKIDMIESLKSVE